MLLELLGFLPPFLYDIVRPRPKSDFVTLKKFDFLQNAAKLHGSTGGTSKVAVSVRKWKKEFFPCFPAEYISTKVIL